MKPAPVRGPIQYGDGAVVFHVASEQTHGDPERRTLSAIGSAMTEARRFTIAHPSFKAKVLWAGREVYVRGGKVYLAFASGLRREFPRMVLA